MRVALLVVLLLLSALPARAEEGCSCRDIPLPELMRGASLAFQGQAAYPFDDQPEGSALFVPEVIYKGVELVRPVVLPNRPNGNAACAVKYEVGKTYEVFALGTFETGYYTDACLTHEVEPGDANRTRMDQLLRMRLEQGLLYMTAHPPSLSKSSLELEKIRDRAASQLALDNPELALRLYAQSSELSRNSPVDLLGQGQAALKLMMAKLALERFDDVLEKDNSVKAAWSGRYQALALLDRWSELPQEKADLTGFYARHGSIRASLKAPVFAGGWWDEIDATASQFPGADFSKALLTDVNFSDADLTGANFTGAELRGVNFSGANLTGALLKDARLSKLRWNDKTRWPEGFDPKSVSPN